MGIHHWKTWVPQLLYPNHWSFLTAVMTLELQISFNLGIWCSKGLGSGKELFFSQSEVTRTEL